MRVVVGLLVLLLSSSVLGCSSGAPSAGLWYDDGAFVLPHDISTRLGGTLRPDEVALIKKVSSTELERAFFGLRIKVTGRRDAFWRVEVLDLVPRMGGLPSAGQSFSLGALGGTGSVGLRTLAQSALDYAPAGTQRQGVIEGIGRGVGRAAAHEFAHQILGPAMRDNHTDPNSYEYFSADRQSQFYGELRWVSAWPLLRQKLGSSR